MLSPIRNELCVPVVDARYKRPIMVGALNARQEQIRVIHNTAWPFFWPDLPVCFLNWETTGALVQNLVTKHRQRQEDRGEPLSPAPQLNRMYWKARLQEPVEYKGVAYLGDRMWGSSVKKYITVGTPEDILVQSGLVTRDVHALYSVAAALPDALYGAGYWERPRVLVLPVGATFAGQVIADGIGIFGANDYWIARDHNRKPMEMRKPAGNNYQVSQCLDWNVVEGDVKKLVAIRQERLERFNIHELLLRWLDSQSGEYKRQLAELDPAMLRHPYVVAAINSSQAEYMAELASSIPFDGVTRVAIPTLEDNWVYELGRWLGVRWPVDSKGNITAIEVAEETPDYERVMNAEVCQTREVQPLGEFPVVYFSKGMKYVVPQEEMQGFDLVVCSKDIKMINQDLVALRQEAESLGQVVLDIPGKLYIGITQAYQPGLCVGCPIELWEEKGGDFDGDLHTMYDANDVPALFEHVRSLRSAGSYKVFKTYRELENRAHMIFNSFHMIIGLAVNVVSTTFCTAYSETDRVAGLLSPVVQKGISLMGPDYAWALLLEPREQLDVWRTSVIKVMTDGFKSSIVNLKKWSANLSAARSLIRKEFNGIAPWPTWKQSTIAFRHQLPVIRDEFTEEQKAYWDTPAGQRARRDQKWLMHIPPEMRAATTVRIYKLWEPWLKKRYSKVWERYEILSDPIDVSPLSDFAPWAKPCTQEQLDTAFEFKAIYDGASGNVDWHNGEQSKVFKDTWQKMCEDWADEHFRSRQWAAYALWRACHHARSSYATAAAVFMGFPLEAKYIVEHKPGARQNQLRSVLVGMERNLSTSPRKTYETTEVQIAEVKIRGRTRLGYLVVGGEWPGLLKVRMHGEPSNLIGLVPAIEPSRAKAGFDVPTVGIYNASFSRMENSIGSYIVFMQSVDED